MASESNSLTTDENEVKVVLPILQSLRDVGDGMQETSHDTPVSDVPALTGSQSVAPDFEEARKAQPHCDDEVLFKNEEMKRRKINMDKSGREMFFASHCWRNPETQFKKRQIIAHLSTPIKDGGPGLVYWGDFLDLQAEGPVPWRKEIEEGIAACSKFVIFLDKAWATSYNCLQELQMAKQYSKPIVVLILDQEGWDLLTVPGGAEEAQRVVDENNEQLEVEPAELEDMNNAYTENNFGAALKVYEGEEIVESQTMSLALLKQIFAHLSSINLCPCRPLEEKNKGYRGILHTAADYVQKDLAYYKEHAHLKNKAMAWDQAVKDGGPKPLLQYDEAVFWLGWIQRSIQYKQDPSPTDPMTKFVAVSMKAAKNRKLMIRLLALLLIVVLAAGVVVSTIMTIKANKALEASKEAEAAAKLAEAEAEAQAEAAWKSSVMSMALASSSSLNSADAKEWQIKVLRMALQKLPTEDNVKINNTLLKAGRGLMLKPYTYSSQVIGPSVGYTAAWSPDGSRVAAASKTGKVTILSISSSGGLVESQVLPYEANFTSVAWSPDSSTLAFGSMENVVCVWTSGSDGLLDPESLEVLSNHASTIWAVAWSPDGLSLASGSADTTVEVWDRHPGGWINSASLYNHSDQVTSVAWSPDGECLATASADQTVVLWKVQLDGSLNESMSYVIDVYLTVISLAWSTDSQNLAMGTANWDLLIVTVGADGGTTMAQTLSAHSGWVEAVAWSPDGLSLASAAAGGTVIVWSTTGDGTVVDPYGIRVLQTDSEYILSLSWSPDSSGLIASSAEGNLHVWKLGRESLLGAAGPTVVRHDNTVADVDWSPDGSMIATACYDAIIRVWTLDPSRGIDYTSLQELKGHSYMAWVARWSPAGSKLASGAEDQTVMVWQFDANGMLDTSTEPQILLGALGAVWYLAWSPDGSSIAATSTNHTVVVWTQLSDGTMDAANPQVLEAHDDLVWSVAWSPDGSRLVSSAQDNSLHVWSAGEGGLINPQILQTHQFEDYDYAVEVRFSPDGSSLALSMLKSHVTRVVAVTEDNLLDADNTQIVSGHKAVVYDSAWSPDGTRLATASFDSTIRLWDVYPNGTVETSLSQEVAGHLSGIYALAWSPDSLILASASTDLTLRLWKLLDVDTFKDALETLPIASWDLTSEDLEAAPVVASLNEFGKNM